jgi:hypothetical protein
MPNISIMGVRSAAQEQDRDRHGAHDDEHLGHRAKAEPAGARRVAGAEGLPDEGRRRRTEAEAGDPREREQTHADRVRRDGGRPVAREDLEVREDGQAHDESFAHRGERDANHLAERSAILGPGLRAPEGGAHVGAVKRHLQALAGQDPRNGDVEHQAHDVGSERRESGAREAQARSTEVAEDEDHAEQRLDEHDHDGHGHRGSRVLVGAQGALEGVSRPVREHRRREEPQERHGDLDDLGRRVEQSQDRARHEQREQEPQTGHALREEDRCRQHAPGPRVVVRADGARHERDAADADRDEQRLDQVQALGGVAPGRRGLTA